jgi:phospholipase C
MPIPPNAPLPAAGPTRRRLFIDTAKAIAAAAALMPPNVRKALAQETSPRGSFRDIKHVVLLMQENRSFDHYYGTPIRGARVR